MLTEVECWAWSGAARGGAWLVAMLDRPPNIPGLVVDDRGHAHLHVRRWQFQPNCGSGWCEGLPREAKMRMESQTVA
eukprot:5826523-Amphidinium_carterae.1